MGAKIIIMMACLEISCFNLSFSTGYPGLWFTAVYGHCLELSKPYWTNKQSVEFSRETRIVFVKVCGGIGGYMDLKQNSLYL